jgi:CRISPR/Cas system-associated protein Csm6
MDDKEIQQEFINFLAKKSGAKTEAELNKYLKSLSKEEQSKLKDEFTQYMQ